MLKVCGHLTMTSICVCWRSHSRVGTSFAAVQASTLLGRAFHKILECGWGNLYTFSVSVHFTQVPPCQLLSTFSSLRHAGTGLGFLVTAAIFEPFCTAGCRTTVSEPRWQKLACLLHVCHLSSGPAHNRTVFTGPKSSQPFHIQRKNIVLIIVHDRRTMCIL